MNEDNVLFQSEADSVESASPHESLEAETEENVLVTEPEETISEETVPEKTTPEESSSALTELIEAIKTELANSEAESEAAMETSEAVDETDEDGEAYEEEVDLIDNIHGQSYDGSLEVYTLASDSNASGAYQEVVVNRLDNILTCSIITACCAILVLFHTLKKE